MSASAIAPPVLTVPGQTTIAQGYHDYVWLYTDGEEVCQVVDGAPPGPEGRKYTVPVGRAVKVPREVGRFFTEHLGYSGVVIVHEADRADGTGTDLDLASAKEESKAKFVEGDELRWQQYMGYVMWKLEKKEIVPPPPDTILRLMKRRGYKLTDYGIIIPGAAGGGDPAMASAQHQIAELTRLVGELKAQLDDALGNPAPKAKSAK